MKTVLFAIDHHMIPDQKALNYSLTLCRRLLAKLDVLHIIQSPDTPGRGLKTLKSGILKAREKFENAMVTATYAEAGVPDPESALKAAAYDEFKRLLPKKENAHIDYHCVVTGEPTDSVIERYVHGHRDVVLTVFDPESSSKITGKKTKGRTKGRHRMPKLAIPLVLVKDAK